jgi:energy-coupling factor transporter transmembrane protein EcfT
LTRHKSYWWGIAVTGLYALSPLTVDHTRMVMSEPVFMTFSLLVLLLSEQAARGAQTRWWGPAMSVAMVGAVFTRTIGVVLLAVIFVYLMVVRGKGFWRHIALVASQMGLLVGLIVVATSVRPQDLVPSAYMRDDAAAFLRSPYVEGVALQLTEEGTPSRETNAGAVSTDWKQRIKTCLVDNLIVGGIVQHLGGGVRCIAVPLGCGEREQDLANRIGIPTLPLIIGLLVSGLVLLGLARSLAQTGSSAFVVSGFVYLGSLFLWLWDDVRLLYLIQPQIHFGLLLGLEAIPMWIAPLSRKESLPNMRGVLLGILVLALIMASIVKAQRLDDTRLHTADLEARARWLMQYTSDSDIVMSEEPQTDFVYTGRKTVPYPTSQTSTELEVYLRTYKVSRVFIAPAVQWQSRYTPVHSQDAVRILPLLQALVSQGHMKHVYSSETNLIQVYQTQFQD